MNREEYLAHTKKWSVEEFNDWKKSKAAKLEEAQAQNQRAVDSAVIKSVTGLLKQGMTIDAAGDLLLRNGNFVSRPGIVWFTDEAILKTLKSIGYRTKGERKKGG